MAQNALILKGNLKIGADAGSAVEVGDDVVAFKITATRDVVDIPATMGAAKTFRAGDAQYGIEIEYLATDASATSLWSQFFDAVADADGTLYFEGSLQDGAVSATNPKWSGNFIVTGAALGGTQNTLAMDSQSFPLLAKPTKATS